MSAPLPWFSVSGRLKLALLGTVIVAVLAVGVRPWEVGESARAARAQPGAVAFGIDARPTRDDADLARHLGTRLVRMEFPIGARARDLRPTIEGYARHGIQVLPLAGFHGRLPTRREARNIAGWAREFGPRSRFWRGRDRSLAVRAIEFGNETSFTHQFGDTASAPSYVRRAKIYALRFRTAQKAISRRSRGVGLLAQGDDGGSGTAAWVDTLFATVPDLARRAAGWTVHPYGPDWQQRMDDLVSNVGEHGDQRLPIYVTEWGLSSDDGRCLDDNYGWNPCMSFGEAADTLQSTMAQMRGRYGSRLRAVILFQLRDQQLPGKVHDREGYFGAFQARGSGKGPWTDAVHGLVSRSSPLG
jgi:hypothetical protein